MCAKQQVLQDQMGKTRDRPPVMAGTGLVETVRRNPILRPMPQMEQVWGISREARLRPTQRMKALRRAISRRMAMVVIRAMAGTRLSADRALTVRRMPGANLHWS